jgi:glucan phosphoethanolaminetransferase (alkaline phosphatase superfamily)
MEYLRKHFAFILFLVLTTLVFSILILIPNYRHYPFNGFRDLIFVGGHWLISTLGIFFIVLVLSINRYFFLIVFPLFAMVSIATGLFTWQFDVSINSALIESIFYTNVMEASGFLSMPLVITLLFSLGLSAFFVYLRFKVKWTKKQVYIAVILFVVSYSIFWFVNQKRYNTMLQRNPFSYYLATKEYLKERKEISKERLMMGEGAFSEQDSLVIVFVIGEALRADHVQMNGYHRETMPNMERRGVVFLPHLFSPYTHTAQSLPYILTRAKADLIDPAANESSFIDAFNSSSFHTAWIGNQNPTKTYRFFVSECDTVYINKPQFSDYSNVKKLDSDLLEPFARLAEKDNPKQLINLHLMGNHWWYNSNYPDSFAVFTPIMESKIISEANRERMINSYDNATLFSDYLLDIIIESIEGKNSMLIFLSDHGQSFGEEGKWLHTNNTAAEQNPAGFIWLSQSYRKKFPEKFENLLLNQLKPINTSFLFHTILDGATIHSPFYDPRQSLFSPDFQP